MLDAEVVAISNAAVIVLVFIEYRERNRFLSINYRERNCVLSTANEIVSYPSTTASEIVSYPSTTTKGVPRALAANMERAARPSLPDDCASRSWTQARSSS